MIFGLFLFTLYFVSTKFVVVFAVFAVAAFMAVPFFGSIQGILVWIAYLAYLGSAMINHYTGINPFVAGIVGLFLLASITVKSNGVQYTKSLLPHSARRVIAATIIIATMFYLHYVKAWAIGHFILLALPMVLFNFVNIHDIMDENSDWHREYDTFSG